VIPCVDPVVILGHDRLYIAVGSGERALGNRPDKPLAFLLSLRPLEAYIIE
jgi:hypothetical protein